jgi:uncharacterized membrane protein
MNIHIYIHIYVCTTDDNQNQFSIILHTHMHVQRPSDLIMNETPFVFYTIKKVSHDHFLMKNKHSTKWKRSHRLECVPDK